MHGEIVKRANCSLHLWSHCCWGSCKDCEYLSRESNPHIWSVLPLNTCSVIFLTDLFFYFQEQIYWNVSVVAKNKLGAIICGLRLIQHVELHREPLSCTIYIVQQFQRAACHNWSIEICLAGLSALGTLTPPSFVHIIHWSNLAEGCNMCGNICHVSFFLKYMDPQIALFAKWKCHLLTDLRIKLNFMEWESKPNTNKNNQR
jgi:hypothetical protein